MTLRLNGSTSGFTEIDAPAIAGSNTLTLPGGNGTNGQVLTTDGAGALSFTTVAGAGSLADGSAAAPSVAFASDVNTGLFRAGSDALAFTTGGTQRAVIDASGQLGIGTATPATSLHLLGANTAARGQLSVAGNAADPRITLYRDSSFIGAMYGNTTTGVSIAAESGYAITFNPGGGSEKARFDSNGRLFYGTTSAIADGRICLKGDFGTNRGVVIESNQSSADIVRFQTSSGHAGTIISSGTSTTYATSSDYRLKENVVPLAGATDRFKQLLVHRFNFIAEPEKTVDGFIAHEAQAVVPECVTGEKDAVDDDGNPEYQGIDQSKLVPLLTAALQEAIAKIETLEARLTALEVTP
jgi:hypothetical protein